jgi:chromosome segregation ATPase
MGTRSEEVEVADASVTFGVRQPRLEVVIHKTTTSSSPEGNVSQLQWDITTLGSKYEFL